MDKIAFQGEFDMRDFPDGTYRLDAVAVKSTSPQKNLTVGSFAVPWKSGTHEIFKGHYQLDLKNCPEEFKGGEFYLKINVIRIFRTGKFQKGLLMVSRWIPFFRVTDWDGRDPVIKDDAVLLDEINQVSTYTILPLYM